MSITKTLTRPAGEVMHDPPHPGTVLWTLWLEPLDITVRKAAAALGTTPKTLSMIINERQRISPAMAVRLSIALGTSAEMWLRLQTQFDLWHAEQHRKTLRTTVSTLRSAEDQIDLAEVRHALTSPTRHDWKKVKARLGL